MLSLLNKPHPFIFNAYSIAIPSALTFLIIVLLAPFNFQSMEITNRAIIAGVLAVLVAVGVFLTVTGLKKLFPARMSEDRWTLGKEFLLVLLVVAKITFLILIAVLLFQTNQVPFLSLLAKTAFITLAISILPILVLVLFEQYRHQSLQLTKATALTEALKIRYDELQESQSAEEMSKQSLLIKSETDDIELQLTPEDLVYVKSDGNYVEVYFYNAGEIQKKVLRNRLKAIENMLPPATFFRCHNRFIVNGSHIIRVEGNARALLLHLKGAPIPVPVSRAKAKAIAAFLENLPKR